MNPSAATRRAPGTLAAVAIALGTLAAIALVMAVGLALERRLLLRQAQDQVATLSAVLQENTARTFGIANTALQGLALHLSQRTHPRHDEETRKLLLATLRGLPTVRSLFVVGPDGFIQHDTDYPRTPDISLADRGYFRAFLQDPALQSHVSPALLSRSGAGWFIAASRRITGPDGRFAGIVVAAVQLDSFSRLYKQLNLQPGQVMSLYETSGRLLARYPADDAAIGRSWGDTPPFDRLARESAGVFETEGPPLDYPRVVSFRVVEDHPFVVVISTSKASILSLWHQTAAAAGVALVLLSLLTALGLRFFLQRQEQGRRLIEHRAAQAKAAALAEANAKFRAFFEQGYFFACVLAGDGTVLEANDAGMAACGTAREQAVGRKFWEWDAWAAAASAKLAQDALRRALAGETAGYETAYARGAGSQRLIELVFSPIRGERAEVSLVAVVGMDITEHKRQEEQLRAQAAELQDADRARSEFLSTLSHELRNVLGPLQNGLHVLDRADPQSQRALKMKELMHRQLGQLRRLVDDLLDVARVNSGKVRLDMERIDFRTVLAAAAAAGAAAMEGPGHTLETSWPDEPLYVEVDTVRMLQVLSNLLGNAAKYTPPGGRIQLRARREGRELMVEVVDNGLGIPLDAQARVFDMFRQVPSHLAQSQGGLGIGLALVQKLVSLQGGHVEAFSDGPGQGSTFTVYLPLADGPDAGAGRPAEGAAAGPA
ncbi:ATP-binding protein [Ramlibacter montanisoli]|uniref:histidine kinase n=1 Tax=Ramlibacter montanisoli TaxID=2732512 RepID=A0A849KDT3_9BURK|nr:ATP-binding protein [Ramlibacter montanisoli]NNU44684.1 PAS domain-containing protein [Ramlibacter montanisoli]